MDRSEDLFKKLDEENVIHGDESVLGLYLALKDQMSITTKYSDKEENKVQKDKEKLREYLKEIDKRADVIKKNFFPDEDHKIIPWIRSYCKAQDYYSQNKTLLPEVEEVWNFNGTKFKVYNWVKSQRTLYNRGLLSESKIKLLDEIGMVWEPQKSKYHNG